MLDPNNPQNFTHWFSHRLAFALRFVDVFTRRPIATPLSVTLPEQGWIAVYCAADASYRFLVTEALLPSGSFQVVVEDPNQCYINHSPISLTLSSTSPTPPISRGDYLIEHALWPTRKFRVPTGETAVVGRLVSSGANPVDDLDIRLFPVGEAPPAIPFARSNPDGEFLFRLPAVSRESDGTPRPASIEVEVRHEGVPLVSVTPSEFPPDPGRVQFRSFQIP
jgi:hypothetical protein